MIGRPKQSSLVGRLLAARDGVTVVEFALIAPVLIMTLLGLFDMGYNMYAQTLLQGALQKAARDSTLEGASGTASSLDSQVTTSVKTAITGATVTYTRKAYSSFSAIGTAEDYTDTNSNGSCDAGEPYEDTNANNAWDRDRGATGLGGARDAVLYTASMSYPRAFPLGPLVRLPPTVTIAASTVLRNQPYASSQSSTPVVRNCP